MIELGYKLRADWTGRALRCKLGNLLTAYHKIMVKTSRFHSGEILRLRSSMA
jgi:hypothetical protein